MESHNKIVSNFLLSIFISFLLGISLSQCKPRKYNGDKILRVAVSNGKEWETIEGIMRKYTAEDDIWSSPAKFPSFGDIRVSPEEYDIVTSQLKESGLEFKIFIDNIQDFVDAENLADSKTKSKPFRRKRATMSNKIIGTYATYEEIVKYIYDAEKNFEIASVLHAGDSLEGRPLLVLKLGIPHPDPKVVKPVIWIDSAIHAREWIAPASLMYIIYQLLNGYHEKDPVIFDLLKRIDWMFMPVVNPDGYVYSHTDERLWRKNRAEVNGSTCLGVDLNRNFDFHWGEETASDDPCHVMFRGVSAASEIETQHLQNFLMKHRSSIYVYISLHSYSQYWFSRWAYTDEKVATHDEMIGLARIGVKEINKINNEIYEAGLSHQFMYGYSGGSPDWAHGEAGIPYSYTIELRDRGTYGFVLPKSYIMPTARELYAGVMAVGHYIKNVSGIMDTFPEGDTSEDMSQEDTSLEDASSGSDVPSGGNTLPPNSTFPPFIINEAESTTTSPHETKAPSTELPTPSGGNGYNRNPPGWKSPTVQPPPVYEGETSGGRDDVLCTGPCLTWWETINRESTSRLPRFYQWLFARTGRFGPWRAGYARRPSPIYD